MFIIWTNLNPLHPRMICTKFEQNWTSGSGEEDFLKNSVNFYIFVIISPWKWPMVIIWTQLNPLPLRMICAKFGWNWPSGSGEDFFLIFSAFLHFRYYLPLELTNVYHLNKVESPSPKDASYQFWLKLAQWFWRRRFLNDHTQFSHFCDYLPFEAGQALCLNKLESSSPKDDLVLSTYST